jgi:hypothetical protein
MKFARAKLSSSDGYIMAVLHKIPISGNPLSQMGHRIRKMGIHVFAISDYEYYTKEGMVTDRYVAVKDENDMLSLLLSVPHLERKTSWPSVASFSVYDFTK